MGTSRNETQYAQSKSRVVSDPNKFADSATVILHVIVLVLFLLSLRLEFSILTSILSFIFMFLFVGQAIRLGIFRVILTKATAISSDQRLLIDILLSMTITTLVTIPLSLTGFLSSIIPIIVLVMINFDFTYIVVEGITFRGTPSYLRETLRVSRKYIWQYFFLIFVSLFIALWRLSYRTWPEASGTDLFTHLGVTNLIIENNGIISHSWDYPYFFHSFAASISQISGLNPFVLFSYGNMISILLGIMLVYKFAFSFSGSYFRALIVAGLFSFVAEGGSLLGIHYLYPSTYAFLAGLVIITAIRNLPNAAVSKSYAASAFISVSLVYPSFIPAYFPLVMLLWTQRWSSVKIRSAMERFLAAGTIIGVACIPIYYLVLPLAGIEITSTVLGFSFLTIEPNISRNVQILFMAYSPVIVFLLIFGLSVVLRQIRRGEHEGFSTYEDGKFIGLISLYFFTLFLFPLEYGIRTESFARPFYFLIIVIGMLSFAEVENSSFSRDIAEFVKPSAWSINRFEATLVALLILTAMIPTIVTMDRQMTNEPHNPHIDELQAFEWLLNRVPVDGYVLTDPASGFLMRSFILRNCSTSKIESGFFIYPLRDLELFGSIFNFYNASQGEENEHYESITALRGEPDYIVVSPRSTSWLALARSNNTGLYAVYSNWLSESDPSLAKFVLPDYTAAAQFGDLRILIKTNI